MNVISASRRTDIPAFYWRWFIKRIEEGFCHWVNPFNAKQVFRVPMQADDVAAFVFWTRDAGPMLPDVARLHELGFMFYVQYTINGYPREFEHHSPKAGRAVETLRFLSNAIGPERITWRYDPVILSSVTPPEYHLRKFKSLAGRLRSAVRSVYISFCEPYGKTRRRFQKMTERLGWSFAFGSREQHAQIVARMAEISAANDMQLYTCAEAGLEVPGVKHGSCVDPERLAALRPDLDFNLRPAPTRAGCGCVESVDIGAYDTCAFGCEYCYANSSLELPRRRMREHDPDDSVLWRPPSLTGVDLNDPSVSTEPKPARIRRRNRSAQLTFAILEQGHHT